VTPAEALSARAFEPFCANSVLGTINALADFSHSNAMAQLATAGKYRSEMLLTLAKVAPPRYANFIGRFKDDPDAWVRRGVASALGLIDNEKVAVPALIHMLTRNDQPEDVSVKTDAAASLVAIGKRTRDDGVRRRLLELLREPNPLTAALGARVLAALGDPRGAAKLRELTTHAQPRVREEAVLALGEVRDAGSSAALAPRLKDDSLAVRAAAVYALGRIGGASTVPMLRKAIEESLEYEKALERRKQQGQTEQTVREQYGLGAYDLRETLQEAITTAESTPQR
jgi:HEAT repeat protein